MSIIINNIKTHLEEPSEEAIRKAVKMLGVDKSTVETAVVMKRAVDARKHQDIKWVSSVCVTLSGDEQGLVQQMGNKDILFREEQEITFSKGSKPMKTRPYVIGFGPSGMFAALVLARQGYRPVVLERGMAVEQRVEEVQRFWKTGVLNPTCNVQFGEGGAGTFSDGKLVTRVKDPLSSFVLKELVAHGAPEEILYQAKPHIGTDLLRSIVRSIRQEIISLGGEIHFSTMLEDVKTEQGQIIQIRYNNQWQEAQVVVLAIGHSARDTFSMLHQRGVLLENKPFSVGVRIEHLQEDVDGSLYGSLAGNPFLPPGEYQLAHRENGRGVYTFCMCPGGLVVPSASQEGEIVTNGMSEYARNRKNANSALVVSVDSNDFGEEWNSGILFQQKLEQAAYGISQSYQAPCQTVDLFLQGKRGFQLNKVKPSYSLGVVEADFSTLFPQVVTQTLKIGLQEMRKKLRCFSKEDSVLTGVETRTSSPVRITRNGVRQSENTARLYPCGEGAGYAGGITSAAIDGIATAQAIMEEFSPYSEQ